MFVEDVSPSGVIAGRKLARDTAIVNGSGGEFSALRNGYQMAQRMAAVADLQHAVGGVRLEMVWDTPGGAAPTAAGTYRLDVRATDATGKPVGFVPVVQLSDLGIDARPVDRCHRNGRPLRRHRRRPRPMERRRTDRLADRRHGRIDGRRRPVRPRHEPAGRRRDRHSGCRPLRRGDPRARLGTRLPHAGSDRQRRSVLGHRRPGPDHLEWAATVGLGTPGDRRAGAGTVRGAQGTRRERHPGRHATCRASCSPWNRAARRSPRRPRWPTAARRRSSQVSATCGSWRSADPTGPPGCSMAAPSTFGSIRRARLHPTPSRSSSSTSTRCRPLRSRPARSTQPTATSSSTPPRRTERLQRSSTPSATRGSCPEPRTSPGVRWCSPTMPATRRAPSLTRQR